MVNSRDWPWIPQCQSMWVVWQAVQVSLRWSYLVSRHEEHLKIKECGHNNLGKSCL